LVLIGDSSFIADNFYQSCDTGACYIKSHASVFIVCYIFRISLLPTKKITTYFCLNYYKCSFVPFSRVWGYENYTQTLNGYQTRKTKLIRNIKKWLRYCKPQFLNIAFWLVNSILNFEIDQWNWFIHCETGSLSSLLRHLYKFICKINHVHNYM
jgi:hypothetical protein